MEQEGGPEVYSLAGGEGRCGGMAASNWERELIVPPVRDGGRNWGPLGLRVRRELWATAMGLDLVGRDG